MTAAVIAFLVIACVAALIGLIVGLRDVLHKVAAAVVAQPAVAAATAGGAEAAYIAGETAEEEDGSRYERIPKTHEPMGERKIPKRYRSRNRRVIKVVPAPTKTASGKIPKIYMNRTQDGAAQAPVPEPEQAEPVRKSGSGIPKRKRPVEGDK